MERWLREERRAGDTIWPLRHQSPLYSFWPSFRQTLHELEEPTMFRDQPSIPIGPFGVGLSSLTRWMCCGLLTLAPIGIAMASLRGATSPTQENGDRAEGDRKEVDERYPLES